MSARYPAVRLRRLRRTPALRKLVRETRLHAADFVYPLFVQEGRRRKDAIASMPGQYRYSVDTLAAECARAARAGVTSVLLFGLPSHKDARGTGGYSAAGVVPKACAILKKEFPDIVVMADVCLCEYTSHGHCGVIKKSSARDWRVDNDETLPLLAKAAVAYADAGADVIAPSDMMDGRVAAIRSALDRTGHADISILSYAAKYASSFYGPFRDAADCAPQMGDRATYQMDPANVREALREIEQDLAEGADAVMVKPALAYLDVIRAARDRFDAPLAAYNVSGEYSMVKAAVAKGWLDERRAALETLTAIKRAGADFILTYWAVAAATWVKGE